MKNIDLEVKLYGDGYVGDLKNLSIWFKKKNILPPIGSSVLLPRTIKAAVSKLEDEQGFTTMTKEVEIPETIGTVDSILFTEELNEISIIVIPFIGNLPKERVKGDTQIHPDWFPYLKLNGSLRERFGFYSYSLPIFIPVRIEIIM